MEFAPSLDIVINETLPALQKVFTYVCIMPYYVVVINNVLLIVTVIGKVLIASRSCTKYMLP